MISALNCIVCGGAVARQWPAVVSPFVALRVWARKPFSLRLFECSVCGHRFYSERLESREQMALYCGYRNRAYQEQRESVEPIYTAEFNAALSAPAHMQERRDMIASILWSHIPVSPKVLDFGGDGSLVLGMFPLMGIASYDIGGAGPTLGACQRLNPDVVVCSNVLEHVAFPRVTLNEIASICTSDTVAFIEVPIEDPLAWPVLRKRMAQYWRLLCARPRVALSLLHPGMLWSMHEHVSFFSLTSFRRLTVGWREIASGGYTLKSGGSMMWFLGKRGEACA